jgi:hypothetical protein
MKMLRKIDGAYIWEPADLFLSFAPIYSICMLLALTSFVTHIHNYVSCVSLRVQSGIQTWNGEGKSSWQWQCLLEELLGNFKGAVSLGSGKATLQAWGRH